jgi:peptidoglycan/LPS O-acetylase OafA/YrhL
MAPEKERVFGLDVMRAAAISLVLLSHAAIWLRRFKLGYVFSLLGGYFGVELFFVLSGFLIGGILFRWLTNPESATTLMIFWRRRWFRTLPNYFLFLGINSALYMYLFPHSIPPFIRYLFFCQNIGSTPPEFFNESWSLAIEEWFYLLVPIALASAAWMSPKYFRSNSFVIIIFGVVSITLARSVYVGIEQPMWLQGVRQIVIYRLDACMFGVLAAWVKCFHPSVWQLPRPALPVIAVLICALISGLAVSLPEQSVFLHIAGFPLTSIAAMLLLPTLDSWQSSIRYCGGFIRCLSKWSYSLYFVNLPIFALLLKHYRYNAPLLCTIAFLVFSVASAALCYRFYEKPMMNLRDNARFA